MRSPQALRIYLPMRSVSELDPLELPDRRFHFVSVRLIACAGVTSLSNSSNRYSDHDPHNRWR